jgi:hypothetical protein
LAGRGVVQTRNDGKQTHNLNNKPPCVRPFKPQPKISPGIIPSHSGGPGRIFVATD